MRSTGAKTFHSSGSTSSTRRAREILSNLEKQELDVQGAPVLARHEGQSAGEGQMLLFSASEELVLEKLRQGFALHLMKCVDTERLVGLVKDAPDDMGRLFRSHRFGENPHEIFRRLLRQDIDVGLAQVLAGILVNLFHVLALDLCHPVNALAQHHEFSLLERSG